MLSSTALTQAAPRLRNHYSIQQTLGARLGRRTLLGYDHRRHCQVVVKYLCFDDPLQSNDIRRFHQEIAVLKSLDHPAIPAYIDSFEINEQGYNGLMLVQAYVEGQSLYSLVNAQTFFNEDDLRDISRQILEILAYLHHQQPQIIHRDIKPSSLVLNQADRQVYLVDFGLVQCADEAVADAPILISGTPGYRPPEQLGDRAVPATDLYSLGATLVHLATGQHPNILPQRGLRVLFGHKLGHMSRPFKAWLRWLTQPKQHKRPVSVQVALNGLDHANEIFAQQPSLSTLGHRFQRALIEKMAPADTQLRIFEYSQTLEVIFPPLGWKTGRFWRAFFRTAIGMVAAWWAIQTCMHLWPQLTSFWHHLLIVIVTGIWTRISLSFGYRGFKNLAKTLFQQVSIQLLPDIILVGHRFPCRPVEYQVNTYKEYIDDIDLQPGSSTITFRLRYNRTVIGNLEHKISARSLGLTQPEISWINDILQLWLRQKTA